MIFFVGFFLRYEDLSLFNFNFKKKYFVLGYSWLKVWLFQMNSERTQPCIYMYRFPAPQTFLTSILAHNVEQRPMCYTTGLCWLSHFKYSSVYLTFPESLTNPSHSQPRVCFKSVNLFLFCTVHMYHFFLDSICKGYHVIFLLLWLHSVWRCLGPSMLLQTLLFHCLMAE